MKTLKAVNLTKAYLFINLLSINVLTKSVETLENVRHLLDLINYFILLYIFTEQ